MQNICNGDVNKPSCSISFCNPFFLYFTEEPEIDVSGVSEFRFSISI